MSTKAIIAIVVVIIILGVGWYYFSMQSTTAPVTEEGTALNEEAENADLSGLEVGATSEVEVSGEVVN